MRTFAQIHRGRVHWIFQTAQAPRFAPNIVLMDITDVEPMPKEGWLYDPATDTFSPPPITQPDPIEELRQENLALAQALAALYEQMLGGVAE